MTTFTFYKVIQYIQEPSLLMQMAVARVLQSSTFVILCECVCLHDKTKTAENKIAKLGTEMVHHDISAANEY